jgi:hypothetical protein
MSAGQKCENIKYQAYINRNVISDKTMGPRIKEKNTSG